MAARSAQSRRRSQDSSGLTGMIMGAHRRSSSQSDRTSPQATPSQSQTHLQVPLGSVGGGGASSSPSHALPENAIASAPANDRHGDHHKRPRAFLTELLSGSHPGHQSKNSHLPVVVPSHIIPVARAHLRANSFSSSRDTPSPTPGMASAPHPPPKLQSSPSKVRPIMPTVHLHPPLLSSLPCTMSSMTSATPFLVQPRLAACLMAFVCKSYFYSPLLI